MNWFFRSSRFILVADALRQKIKNAAVHTVVEDTLDVAHKNVVFISENQRKLINIALGFKRKYSQRIFF